MKKSLILCLLALTFGMFSCDVEDENNANGKLSISMTDAPFPTDMILEANVTINKIEVRQAGDEEEGEGEDEDNAFITLSEEETTLNLLDLTGGVTANLVDIEVPVGAYDLVRLYVTSASIMLKDSTEYEVFVPSGAQTGIKVFVDPAIEVVSELTSELLLDFDVSQSFVLKGNMNTPAGIKGFNFKPVIKAANLTTAGRLSGMVTLGDSTEAPLEGVEISVFADDTLNTSTFTGADGVYMVMGLEAGNYGVAAQADSLNPSDTVAVDIFAGNLTTHDFVLDSIE